MNIIQKMFNTNKNVELPTVNNVQQEILEDLTNNIIEEETLNTGELNNVQQDVNMELYNYLRYTEFQPNELDLVDLYYNEEIRRITYQDTVLSIANKVNMLFNNNENEINILDLGSGSGGMLIELNEFLGYLKVINNLPDDYVINYTMVDFNKSVIDYCSNSYTNLSELYKLNINYKNETYENFIGTHDKDIKYDIIICCRSFDYNLFNINPNFREEIQNNYLIDSNIKINNMKEYYNYILSELFNMLKVNGIMYVVNQNYTDLNEDIFNSSYLDIYNLFVPFKAEIKSSINTSGINLDSYQIKKII